jgi:hypothetical protein
MTAIFCIATGSATYMQLALNLGLSVKANCNIETVLLHTNDAEADLGWDEKTVDRRFGFAFDKKVSITVDEKNAKTPLEQAHYLKLSAYNIARQMGYTEVIILDADTIIVPSKNPQVWFDELKDCNFSTYCAAEFDFKTGKQSKEGYTFWCEPLEAMDAFQLTDRMPQCNASFIYFKKSEEAKKVFDIAMDIWHMADVAYFTFDKHNGSKTEEMCFNISCAINHVYPHTIPYFPVYFQYQHEENSYPYVSHYFVAISMAGNIMHTVDLCAYYTQLSKYYRSINGINESFVFTNETKKPKDSPLDIQPIRRRTIWRRGELPNSDAGCFNPSGIMKDGHLYTIFRKEKSMEMYSHKYEHSTAIPHLCTDGDEGVELKLDGYSEKERLEDFRFVFGNDMVVSHTIVSDMTKDTIYSKMGVSKITENGHLIPVLKDIELPMQKQLTEKNWAFFIEEKIGWCIYSLNPYKIFFCKEPNIWEELKVKQPNIKWWQHNRYICNSTNPIKIGDSWLMFFHSKDSGVYSHGACLIDEYTKCITHYFRNGIPIRAAGEGLQKNLIYVSGAVYLEKENILRVYYGEGDSHSCYNDYDAENFIAELKKYKA